MITASLLLNLTHATPTSSASGSPPWPMSCSAPCGRIGLQHTRFATATCGTIRLRLLKIGALVRISCRRIKLAMASAFPCQQEYALAHLRLAQATF